MSDVTQPASTSERADHRWTGSRGWVFTTGAAIGVLGGLIGLGGAEFWLPLLIGVFGFAALAAVILKSR